MKYICAMSRLHRSDIIKIPVPETISGQLEFVETTITQYNDWVIVNYSTEQHNEIIVSNISNLNTWYTLEKLINNPDITKNIIINIIKSIDQINNRLYRITDKYDNLDDSVKIIGVSAEEK